VHVKVDIYHKVL